MDFSGITEDSEAIPAIAEAKRFVAARPPVRDLLTLVDATGSRCTAPPRGFGFRARRDARCEVDKWPLMR
jgi:hypothetical protein